MNSDRISGRPTIIDLFAGAGGLSLGCCRAGFQLKLAVESDTHAISCHRTNFPGSSHLAEDIRTMSGDRLLRAAGPIHGILDGLVGGPPCQGFSEIGKKQKHDPRNELFVKFFELVGEIRPRFFLAENVPGILSREFDQMRAIALSHVSGYTMLKPIKACASDYGAPTSRTRILFFGYRSDLMNPMSEKDFLPDSRAVPTNVGEALRGLPTKISDRWMVDEDGWRKVRLQHEGEFWARVFGHIPDGVGDPESIDRLRDDRRVSGCLATLHTPAVKRRFARLGCGENDKVSRASRLNPNGFCPTLRAGTGSDRGSYQSVRPIHPVEDRVITPREGARLQGFPDWFRFAPSKWHSFRQIGNSVSPIFAEAILAKIFSKLPLISNKRIAA